MLLYTPVAPQEIFAGAQNHIESETLEIDYCGKKLLVEPVYHSHGKIVKLISGDSNDYLNPKFQPGNFINYALLTQ